MVPSSSLKPAAAAPPREHPREERRATALRLEEAPPQTTAHPQTPHTSRCAASRPPIPANPPRGEGFPSPASAPTRHIRCPLRSPPAPARVRNLSASPWRLRKYAAHSETAGAAPPSSDESERLA